MSDDLGRAPTRRSLREQRQAGEAADRARERDPATRDQLAPSADPDSSDDTNQLKRVSQANRSRRAADVPFDMVPERTERDSLQRARDREALRAQREAEAQRATAQGAGADLSTGDEPAPVTRRQLRLQALAAARATAQPTSAETNAVQSGLDADAGIRESSDEQLSVEEALEARRQTVDGQGENQQPTVDDGDDLEVIARQRELAARAAVISRRVAERERLKQSTTERKQQTADPFTGAMSRLRHEQAERDLANTGINAPQTSGFQLQMPVTTERPRSVSKNMDQEHDALPPAVESETTAPAETEAQNSGEPISARSAQGLEPLDYLTAGVRRVNTWTLAVIAALVVGAGALVTAIVLISTHN